MTFEEFKALYEKVPVEEYPNNVLQAIRNPLVSCRVSTYMHAPYIKQCLDGILMQKTTFPFEIVIGEDESSDGTREICIEYAKKNPDRVRLFLHKRENNIKINNQPTPKFQGLYSIYMCRGKYQAICEGDDYWRDPYKLQKQVDFLENNPDYGLVHTELDHYYVKTGTYIRSHWKKSGVTDQSGDLYNSLLGGGKSMVYACTACFRRELITDLNYNKFTRYMAGDVPLWLHIAAKSKIGYINESTAVRNVLHFSATQGRDFNYKLKFIQSSFHVYNDFNIIKPFSKNAVYNFKQRFSSNICDLCYQFRQRYDLFEENYKYLDDDYRTINLRVKRFLFKYRINKFISKLLLKISYCLFPSKIN